MSDFEFSKQFLTLMKLYIDRGKDEYSSRRHTIPALSR